MDGRDVTGVSPQRRNVSFVHQFFINYPNMTVFENIASPLRIQRLPRAEIERRVEETAALLHLPPMLGRRPSELSGGQQQRTALARAIVKDARLVLLDEPLANLDYKLREELREELPRLFEGRGTVVVYATSEPHEALLLGGHVATMHEGRVTQFGPTAAAYRAAADASHRPRLLGPADQRRRGAEAGRDDRARGHARWPASGAAAAMPDGRYTLAVRPHHVTPGAPDRGRRPARGHGPADASSPAPRASRISASASGSGSRRATACTPTGSASRTPSISIRRAISISTATAISWRPERWRRSSCAICATAISTGPRDPTPIGR